MSYRYEKTESGTELVISGFENGIADSALAGHQQMQHVDIFSMPGAVKAGYKSVLEVNTSALVRWMVMDPVSGYIYGLTTGGVLHQKTGIAGTWSIVSGTPAGNGAGLGIWKGCLIICTSTAIYASPLTALTTWTSILSISSSQWHPVYTGLNTDHLFVGNTRFVAQVVEVGTFDPTNAATYTATANALDLPTSYNVQTIAGLGDNLYMGTYIGSASPYSRNGAVIFPWDKVSDSYGQPISVTGTGVHQLKTIGSVMYLFAGNRADINITNGSTTQLFKRFYNINFPNASTLTDINPDAIGALNDEELLIGIGRVGGNITPLGVYSIREKVHILRNLPSTGNKLNIEIGSILVIDANRFMFSWYDATTNTYGIDLVGNSGRYSDYSTQIDTDLIPVSTFIYPLTFSEIEFKLASVLTTGQGIRIYYRTSLDNAFTLINTWDFASIGARLSFEDNANINNAEYLQLRIELKANANEDTSPTLTQIRLRP